MAIVALSEEQADLLLNIREDPAEIELNSAAQNYNNDNSNKPAAGKSGKFKSRAILCTQQFARLFPSPHRCFLHVTSFCHMFLTLALLIVIPKYAQITSGVGGDNFSALFFVLAITATALVILMGLRKFWDNSFSIYSKLEIRNILKDSIVFTVSLLGISYCCEVDRVPCHLQDGLLFLCIPFSILYMSITKNKEKMNKSAKLVGMLAGFMSLVFLATVPMLAYRFSCRGHEISTNQEENAEPVKRPVWILAYVMFIGFLACSLCDFWSCIQDHEDSSRKSFEWTVWFHFFAFIAIICLFWTNILPSFGMADGIDDLSAKLSSIWSCYFSSHCHTASKLGFLVPVFWLLFLYMSNLLVYRFQSNPLYVMCNACLAIPLLSVFYSLFLFDQMSGIQVKVSLSLGSLITMVTFPIAYAILSCYHSTSVVFNLLDTFDIY
ncbi:Uncharacterized protein APZ42_019743 [Daphnia magna]|uniref:Uncharacterized protein n=1 Tax=Daphnia magna TaxID=35525 RepID=A0A164XP01_9CRUS|nr:Uncharacterized protein APZ42_019743 [Daphnia magna]